MKNLAFHSLSYDSRLWKVWKLFLHTLQEKATSLPNLLKMLITVSTYWQTDRAITLSLAAHVRALDNNMICLATIVFYFLQTIIPSFMHDAKLCCVLFYRKYAWWTLPPVCRYSTTWFHDWDDHVYQSTCTQSPSHSYGVSATTLWATCFCHDTWFQKRYIAHGQHSGCYCCSISNLLQ